MSMNRRDALKSLSAAGLAAGWSGSVLAADKIAVGVIYVGPRDDFGYNQAQAQAAAALKKMPGVKVVEERSSPRPSRCKRRCKR
jgi:simple sugar transport system substrate-binding protein